MCVMPGDCVEIMIYDANGEVVKVFVDTGEENAFTYEKDVVPFVKSLAG